MRDDIVERIETVTWGNLVQTLDDGREVIIQLRTELANARAVENEACAREVLNVPNLSVKTALKIAAAIRARMKGTSS